MCRTCRAGRKLQVLRGCSLPSHMRWKTSSVISTGQGMWSLKSKDNPSSSNIDTYWGRSIRAWRQDKYNGDKKGASNVAGRSEEGKGKP